MVLDSTTLHFYFQLFSSILYGLSIDTFCHIYSRLSINFYQLQYALIKKYNISPGQITRLKRNESVSTHTREIFCKILKCNVEDIMQYIDDENDENIK